MGIKFGINIEFLLNLNTRFFFEHERNEFLQIKIDLVCGEMRKLVRPKNEASIKDI